MPYIYTEYSGNSDEALLPLLVSERTQQLVLAALRTMDSPYAWIGNFDDIDADLALAYEQVSNIMAQPDFTPLGMIAWFMTVAANLPDKWLICDGTTYNKVDYPDLYDMFVGTAYRLSSTQFQVPDLRNRFLYGTTDDTTLDDKAGTTTVALTIAQMPSHNHTQQSRGGAAGAILTTGGYLASTGTPVSTTTTPTLNTGGGEAHNNMPPYIRGYWIIRALP